MGRPVAKDVRINCFVQGDESEIVLEDVGEICTSKETRQRGVLMESRGSTP